MAADWFTNETGTQTLTMPVDVTALAPVVYILRGRKFLPEAGPISPSNVTATMLAFPWPGVELPGQYRVEVRCSNGRIFRWTANVL